MTAATRIYKHSSAGTDWAALVMGAGLGLTLALQMTTVRASDFNSFYAVVVSVSRLAALVGTYFAIVGIFLVARIPWVERGVGHDRLVTWHRKLGPWSLYLVGAHVLADTCGLCGAGFDSVVQRVVAVFNFVRMDVVCISRFCVNDFGWCYFI
jgi:hypothetical protein